MLPIDGLSLNQKDKITVIDFTGNVKLQLVAIASPSIINIATLQPGNYVLKIEMNGGVVTKKFLKG